MLAGRRLPGRVAVVLPTGWRSPRRADDDSAIASAAIRCFRECQPSGRLDPMAHVALFHSMLGLRPVERLAAERLRQVGHLVTTPDLYDGRTASSMADGFS